MRSTKFCTVAFLDAERRLVFNHEVPKQYSSVVITEYGNPNIVVIPEGYDDGIYFSEEFYNKRKNQYNKLVKFDKEKANNLFWFNVEFKIKN